jgi:fatty acid-binding protein DegV
MKRLIITDSTADIPDDIVRKMGIRVIPVNVIMDGNFYKDNVGFTRKDFYDNFNKYETMSTKAPFFEDYA